jgi:hypothetical protein
VASWAPKREPADRRRAANASGTPLWVTLLARVQAARTARRQEAPDDAPLESDRTDSGDSRATLNS